MSNDEVSAAQMERGVSRGKREVCPSDQATRKGLGNLDSLACRALRNKFTTKSITVAESRRTP